MRTWRIISFSLLLVVTIGIILLSPNYVGACKCSNTKTNLLAVYATNKEVTFSGNCTIAEKNYCIEYANYLDMNVQSSFCNLVKGTFTQNGKCSQDNFFGKCKVSATSSKFYYTPFTVSSSRTDCEKISGTFSESFN